MIKRMMIGAALAASVAVLSASAASAAPHLSIKTSDTGSATLQKGVADSPLDSNDVRLKLAVAEQTGDDYVVVQKGKPARGSVDANWQFRFDVRTSSYVGAGAPRISVDVDTNGDGTADLYAYLSAAYCRQPIADSWATANFTAGQPGCSFYTSDGGPYTSWDAFAAAHPGAKVTDAYVVMDEVGQAFVDRIKTRIAA